jgi:hypothetical protein
MPQLKPPAKSRHSSLVARLQAKGYSREEAERLAAQIWADPNHVVCSDPEI